MHSARKGESSPRNRRAAVAAGLAVVALAGGCGAAASSAPGSTSATTTTGIKAAKWGSNVTVTYTSTKLRFRSNGLPNHPRLAQYAVPNAGIVIPTQKTAHVMTDPTRVHNYDYSIPLKPTWSSTTTPTSLGSIGVMISGAPIFNPYEADNKTVAMASNFTIKNSAGHAVPFVDSCAGHPTPLPGGQYHYHGLPACVAAKVDTGSGPSHIIGVAFDGYPIYGERDMNGNKISLSKLDKCNGITSPTPEFPSGTYHYVLTSSPSAQSSIRCFHGVVDKSLIQAMPNMGGGPPSGGRQLAALIASSGDSAGRHLWCLNLRAA